MFSLARELGMTVGEIGRRMSSRELVEWRALANIEREEMEQRTGKAKARPQEAKGPALAERIKAGFQTYEIARRSKHGG